MEEKKRSPRNSLWPFFSRRFSGQLFSWSANNAPASGNSIAIRGFTLIELIIVISIIGILATSLIVLINPTFQIQRANDNRRKAELKEIQAGLEIYRSDQGGYPIDTTHYVQNSGTRLVDNPSAPTTVYIQSVPKDPKSTTTNYYYCTQTSCGAVTNCTSAPCSSYALYACSEEGSKDSEALTPLPSGLSCSFTGNAYYYKVFSP